MQWFTNVTWLILCIFLHYVPPCVFPEIPETPMSREFTVSFIVNLLSSLFREATCGECIYRRSDPLRGWLGLGFGARRPVGCSCGGVVCEPSASIRKDVLCLALLCLCLSHYPLNCCVTVVKILQKVLNRKQDTEVKGIMDIYSTQRTDN